MEKIESVENEINSYVSPQVEILVVEVEKGFANSDGTNEKWNENTGGGDF